MKRYTHEFKEKVVKEFIEGKSCKNICSQYKIPKSCLYDWLKLYKVRTNKRAYESFTYKQFLDLQRELEKTRQELAIIKLSHCFADSPRKEKEKAIERLLDTFPVKTMCLVLDLPKGTFYNYHLRRVKITQYEKHDDFLKTEIHKIFEESNHRFGASKITAKLKSQGVRVSEQKVVKLMQILNLKSKQCKRRSFTPQESKVPFRKNYLKQQFTQTEPNKYWVGDVTMIRVGLNKFYLCVVLDLFSRKVIGYRVSSQNNTSLIIQTFKDAYESRNRPKGLCFHSDQGANYTSEEYRDLLHSLKVKQSYSSKGNPYDNAVIESFFSNFKREEINSHNFEYFEELEECTDSYMKFYNDYRPHESLKNKTPNQVEDDYRLGVLPVLSE